MIVSAEDIRLINSGAVDSRVKGSAGNPVKEFSGEKLQKVYCIFCQKQHGWVTMENSVQAAVSNIVVICNECFAAMGAPPLLQEADIPYIPFQGK